MNPRSHSTTSFQDQFTCTHSRQCIPKYNVCNFRPDCGPTDLSDEAGCPLSSCKLDDGTTCNWKIHSEGTEIQWELATGKEDADPFAPKPDVDATEGSPEGAYLWARPSDDAQGGMMTHFYTAIFGELAPQCKLIFYYWMNGTDLGTLSVLIQNNLNQELIWIESGNHGPLWHEQIIFIGEMIKKQLKFLDINPMMSPCSTIRPQGLLLSEYQCRTRDSLWRFHGN